MVEEFKILMIEIFLLDKVISAVQFTKKNNNLKKVN